MGTGSRQELVVFTGKVLIVAGVAALAYAAAEAIQIILLVFAGLLFAIFLSRLAAGVQKLTGLDRTVAVGLVLIALLAVTAAAVLLLSTLALAEYGKLASAISAAYQALPQSLRTQLDQNADLSSLIGPLRSVVPPVLFGLAGLLLVLFTGIYFALSPRVYLEGLVLLLPSGMRDRSRQVLHVVGEALWLWLVGQIFAMVLVGMMVGIGVWLVGSPVPLQLGIIAGLLEFVPYVGPVLAAAPGVLIAFAQSPSLTVWVVLLYLLIQQVEGHLIQPLVQRAVVSLPPALTIAGVAAGGMLFGLLGAMIATPLMVTILTGINMLYVHDQLGETRHFPPREKVP
jgi:predicted PurR-regulated permease PerM